MSNSITITMPLPPKELWQNRPCHWRKKGEVTKRYRKAAWARSIAKVGYNEDPWQQSKSRLVFYWPDKRRRDIRNAEAAMKPAYDGLVDAGLIADDSYKHLVHDTTEFKFDKSNPRVEITVSQVVEGKCVR